MCVLVCSTLGLSAIHEPNWITPQSSLPVGSTEAT